MVKLVNDLLDVAQIESGKLQLDLQPLDVLKLVEHTVALNRVLAEKKPIHIALEHDGEFPPMRLDAAKIEQVLNNLISNAVKFSPSGELVRLKLVGTREGLMLTVQDHGAGIPANELEKLFKPFSRTSVVSTAGERTTGLGLVIVRRIVEGHLGKIWVESQVGVGSTFFVSLPVLTLDKLNA
jgi:signal transduction histidine kinase